MKPVASSRFLILLGTVYAVGFTLLAVTLYRLQIVDTADYRQGLAHQSTRIVRLAALRGRILDRRGNVLATSRPVRDIVCYPGEFKRRGSVTNVAEAVVSAVARMSETLRLRSETDRDAVLRHLHRASARALPVVRDVADAELARFEERRDEFPGFATEVRAERIYPFGALAAHVLGYVGRDRPETSPGEGPAHYVDFEPRGRSGLEARYDAYLTGSAGSRLLTVDVRGFTTEVTDERAPEQGLDLTLELDAALQLAVERELAGVNGACVAIDPRDGAVRALASAPAYNLNAFVPKISRQAYAELARNPAKPLLNRAVSGRYAPGSIFKPVVALAALDAGWDPLDALECSGSFRNTHCTARWGHGPLTLRKAIERSCNPFFLQIGLLTGGEKIVACAEDFGLGSVTGLDLGGEAGGTVEPWHFQSAIGQGPLLVTPLQMAVVCAAFANGGIVYRPFLHRPDTPGSEPPHRLRTDPTHLAFVRMGMRDVVEAGSAEKAFHPRRGGVRRTLAVQAAGKTGSAEVGSGEHRYKNTWFVAFAPFERPTLAIAMVVEHGDFGGTTVAPRVYNVFRSVFGERTVEKREVGG